MKQITNWRKATVADMEADGLLDEATKIHVLSYNMLGKTGSLSGEKESERIKKFFQHHIETRTPIVMHNGITYDVPLAEKIYGIDLSELMLIDSLSLSWYLNTDRQVHGLDSFFSDYGIAKPKIDDWENLSYEEYVNRCEEDVKINVALWEDFKERLTDIYSSVKRCVDGGLVDGKRMSEDEVCYIDQYKQSSTVDEYVDRILTFLMFKADCARLKEKTKFKVDVEKLDNLIESLGAVIEDARVELEGVMPPVPQYTEKNRPAKPYKKNGELSVAGRSWQETVERVGEKDDSGNTVVEQIDVDTIRILKSYDPPNINGHQQIKDFLFSKGWEPQNFKFVKDEKAQQAWVDSGFKPHLKPKPRAIPQVNIDGDEGKELCPSVVELAERIPEIMAYAKYTTIKHRLDMCKGFKRDLRDGGYLCARVGGYTNTLREQHRELVNLPSVKKPYGKDVRGILVCEEGNTLLGSDMSALEDRVKMHFMMPYDPVYVESLNTENYDPHLTTALASGLITDKDFERYQAGEKDSNVVAARAIGKSTNYACLPTDNTKVLTKSGWVPGKNVVVGEEVMGYNKETGRNEWTKVVSTYLYQDAEVVNTGNFDWKVESTLNHRWYGTKRVSNNGIRSYLPSVFTTEEINSEFNIINSAVYLGGDSKVSPEKSALIAWILADGHYKWSERGEGTSCSFGRRKGVIASIAQASHKYQKEVEEVLLANGFSWKEDKLNSSNENTIKSYRLSSAQFRKFFEEVVGCREQKHEVDWVKWVLNLSPASLESFVYNFWLADGDSKGRWGDSYKTFRQNRGNIADALITAGYLLGYNVTQTGGKCSLIRMQTKRPYTTTQRFKNHSYRRTEVFCLTTELDSFVIRQGKVTTITGNCVYGSGAETLSRTSGMSLQNAKAAIEGYWKLNWSVKAIADDQCVIEDSCDRKWLVNPVNGFAYSLRGEKDIFSTLCQGTGSFFFDVWVDCILEKMEKRFGVRRLNAQFHDEYVTTFRDTEVNREEMERITKEAIEEVNERYLLRRDLGCDVQFGKDYSQIH